jgi:hypothetical protein
MYWSSYLQDSQEKSEYLEESNRGHFSKGKRAALLVYQMHVLLNMHNIL